MHKSRINIPGKPKIMINSQDVYFGMTRQCAQVELKNIFVFFMLKIFRIQPCANNKRGGIYHPEP
jgi:hypothetical protein